jgi:hypothetical protein
MGAAVPRLQFRLRTLLLVVVVLALILLPVVWWIRLVERALSDFYRPGGELERIHRSVGSG